MVDPNAFSFYQTRAIQTLKQLNNPFEIPEKLVGIMHELEAHFKSGNENWERVVWIVLTRRIWMNWIIFQKRN